MLGNGHQHLVVDESCEMSLVVLELDHDELVSLLAWQGEEEGLVLLEPVHHRRPHVGRDDGGHSVLVDVVLPPDVGHLLLRLAFQQLNLHQRGEFLFRQLGDVGLLWGSSLGLGGQGEPFLLWDWLPCLADLLQALLLNREHSE